MASLASLVCVAAWACGAQARIPGDLTLSARPDLEYGLSNSVWDDIIQGVTRLDKRVSKLTLLEGQKPLPRRSGAGDEWLKKWLASLKVKIPDTTAEKATFRFKISNGMCNHIQISGIKTEVLNDPGLSMRAEGLAISCTLHWDAQSTLVPSIASSGEVTAEVADSSIGGPILLVSDTGNPPLPQGIRAHDCSGNIQVTQMQFSGSILSSVLQALRPLITTILNSQLVSVICSNLDEAVNGIGSEALRNASEVARRYISAPVTPVKPPRPPPPMSDYVDLAANPATKLATKVLDHALGDPTSNYSVNKLVTHFLGTAGNLSLGGLNLLPVSIQFKVMELGTVKVTFNNLNIDGLNTFSQILLDAPDPQKLAFKIGLSDIAANASVKLEVDVSNAGKSPLSGGTLLETFDMQLGLQGITANTAGYLAMKRDRLQELSFDQIPHAGCIGPAVFSAMETEADLSLGPAKALLVPTAAGSLEADVDRMVSAMMGVILGTYMGAIEAAARQFIAASVRDTLNKRIKDVLTDPPTCPPPESIFASQLIHVSALWGAVLSMALATLAVILLPVGVKWRKRREVRALEGLDCECEIRASPGAEGSSETTGTPSPREASSDSTTGGCGELPVDLTPQSRAQDTWMTPLGNSSPVVMPAPSTVCLGLHPKVSLALKIVLPLMAIADCLLFMHSNAGASVSIILSLVADGMEVADFPPLKQFTLVGSVKEMFDAGTYPLAFVIAFFSGCWPYIKVVLMMVCWYMPTDKLAPSKRQHVLDFLDACGKWSLVDTYVMVIFMVAFEFKISTQDAAAQVQAMFDSVDSSGHVRVYVKPLEGFFVFLFATILSLILGHIVLAVHRQTLGIGEYSIATDAANPQRQRLCNVLRPPGQQGKVFVYGPILALSVSLLLVCVGIWEETFLFRFSGLGAYILGKGNDVRNFSVLSLSTAVPNSNPNPNDFGLRWLQGAFLLFVCIVVLAYHAILIVLWCAPLSNRLQRHFFVAAQVMNAWQALDVFMLSIVASVLEISTYVSVEVIGQKCDAINSILERLPFADDIPGKPVCFGVDTELLPGFWILATSVVIALVVGHIMLYRCSCALGCRAA